MTTTASVLQVRSTNEVVVDLEEGKEEEEEGGLVDVTTLSVNKLAAGGDTRDGCKNSSSSTSSTSSSSSPTRCQTIGRFIRKLMLVMLLITFVAASLALLTLYIGHMFLLQLIVVVIVAYFVAGGRLRWFYIAFRTLPRDAK